MQERDELRRQVAAILNHDIRTPLSALVGHIEMLRGMEADLNEDVAHSLGVIERSGWKLDELIRSVAELLEQIDELDRGQR